MSLITRCPACETMFKVVPDQLRVSEGWVRCGQCDEIFDASAHLQDGEFAGIVEPVVRETQVLLSHERAEVQDAVAEPYDDEVDVDDALKDLPPEAGPDPLEPEPPEVISSLGQPVTGPHGEAVDALASSPPWRDDFMGAPQPVEPVFSPALASPRSVWPEVSFIREVTPRSVWRRPLVRLALAGASLLLILGLAGQVVLHERDRLAATEPALKPWLQAACAVLDCRLSPLQQIESMVIDSSSFNKIRGDAYRLSFTLKNTALSELATPAMELTLTDSQDRPLIRRVFMPAELGLPPRVLAPGSETSGSLAVSVKVTGPNERIAGYRVLAFYP